MISADFIFELFAAFPVAAFGGLPTFGGLPSGFFGFGGAADFAAAAGFLALVLEPAIMRFSVVSCFLVVFPAVWGVDFVPSSDALDECVGDFPWSAAFGVAPARMLAGLAGCDTGSGCASNFSFSSADSRFRYSGARALIRSRLNASLAHWIALSRCS